MVGERWGLLVVRDLVLGRPASCPLGSHPGRAAARALAVR
jgi:hypothetical protein